ncbi:yddA protein [Escherichia coli DEC12C]|nr:yddA protein [Escherichia coli DEC12C]
MKRGLRNGVAPYIPAAFCRDAGSAGHGATEAARPERSLQARGFASGMEARQGGDSFAGSVHDSPPRRGTPGKGISRRTTKQAVIRTAERPRNERGGASARPLSAPPARGLFPARADGH